MDSPVSPEIDSHVLLRELRELNRKRTQGVWTLFRDRWLIADTRTTPTVAATGTTKAKENAAFLAYLAGNVDTIIERLERLVRLEKLISELPSDKPSVIASRDIQRGATASSVGVISTLNDTQQVVGHA